MEKEYVPASEKKDMADNPNIMRRFSCRFFHKWTVWKDGTVTQYHTAEKLTKETIQTRRCVRCNIIESRYIF